MAREGLAADQKGGRRHQASIVFLDETGFLLQPLSRRNWAPAGMRPVQYAYLRALHRQLRRPLIVVLDRLSAHRSAVRKLHQAGARWLTVDWLPPYAPDLNPVEALWSYAKYSALANFVPDDVDHLHDAVTEVVGDTHFNQQLIRSFFHSAQLNL